MYQCDYPCLLRRKWGWSTQGAHTSTKGENAVMLKQTFPFCRKGSHIPSPSQHTHTQMRDTGCYGQESQPSAKKKRKCWECWMLAKAFNKVGKNGQNTSKLYSQTADPKQNKQKSYCMCAFTTVLVCIPVDHYELVFKQLVLQGNKQPCY